MLQLQTPRKFGSATLQSRQSKAKIDLRLKLHFSYLHGSTRVPTFFSIAFDQTRNKKELNLKKELQNTTFSFFYTAFFFPLKVGVTFNDIYHRK